MQSGVIDGILSVEDEAEKIIENAHKEASSILASANDKAAKLVSDALDEARKTGQGDVDAAEALLESHLAMYEEYYPERTRLILRSLTEQQIALSGVYSARQCRVNDEQGF